MEREEEERGEGRGEGFEQIRHSGESRSSEETSAFTFRISAPAFIFGVLMLLKDGPEVCLLELLTKHRGTNGGSVFAAGYASIFCLQFGR